MAKVMIERTDLPDGTVLLTVPAIPGLRATGPSFLYAHFMLVRNAGEFRELYKELGWIVPEEFRL